MSNPFVEEPELTDEDYERWISKLHRMASSLDRKGDDDGARMFATAAALIHHMAVELQNDKMLASMENPFGFFIGEA